MLLRLAEVRTPMQEGGDFGSWVLVRQPVVGDERVGPQYRFQPLASVASLIAEFLELAT
jgi:hypothetical protein